MSPVRWLDDPPVPLLDLDLAALEIAPRARIEPSGLCTAVPVVIGERSARPVRGQLAAWGRPRGERRWAYALVLWPDRREDDHGRLAWTWRWGWCAFDRRQLRRAHRSETVRGGSAYHEGISAAIRRAMPAGVDLTPRFDPTSGVDLPAGTELDGSPGGAP
ncbi:hypothetical protein [Jiangella asiatica]|uniref:Uncharacterized protein n=1 Tax=Jiangella asiatica TaxID=2530372 RepID=A0A4V2YZG7_9ACTN|nr:hypothetical protein [Jiangella asiatica]TDD97117.1 hypothetical protein E1269_29960 [Jiangella asiatica]